MFDHFACKTCPLNVMGGIAGTYMYRTADDDASVVVVTPSVPRPQELKRLQYLLAEFKNEELDYTFATKCTGDISGKKQKPKKRAEQKHCRAASDEWDPRDRVYVCMGAEAVASFTSESVAKTMFGRIVEVTDHNGEKFKILPTVTLPQIFFYKESQEALQEHVQIALDYIQGEEVDFFRPKTIIYEKPEEVLDFVQSLIYRDKSTIACDTETNSLNQYLADFEILMMSFSMDMSVGHTIVLPGEFSTEPWLPGQETRLFTLLGKLFESKKHRWVFHNASYDTKALARFLDLDISVFENCIDTMLLAHLVNENRSGLDLKSLARNELKFEVWDKEIRDWFKLPMQIKQANQEYEQAKKEAAERYRTHKALTKGLTNKLEKTKLRLDGLREESDSMLEDVKKYAAVDAAATFGLWDKLAEEIQNDPWLTYFFKHFLRVYPATLSAVEHTGIKIDEQYFFEYRDKLIRHIGKIEQAFKQVYFEESSGIVFVADFGKAYTATDKNDKEFRKILRDFKKNKLEPDTAANIYWTLDDILDELHEQDPKFSDSFEDALMSTWTLRDQHVEELIRNHFDLPILAKTTTGQLSLTSAVIDEYIEHTEGPAQAFFRLYKIYEDLSKNLSTYVNGFIPFIDDSYFLHGNFIASGTLTGRLSSRNPNLQNVKKTPEILRMFTSRFGRNGLIVSADYSQAELRKLAVVSQDEGFLAAYRLGIDLHRLTAAKTFQLDIPHLYSPEENPNLVREKLDKLVEVWQRNLAKTINFGIVYGMQAKGFSAQTGYHEAEAEEFIQTYFLNAPGVLKWIRLTELFSLYHGYTMSPLGRKRRIPNFSEGRNVLEKAVGQIQEVETFDAFLDAILDKSTFDADSVTQIIEYALGKMSREVPINILRKDLRAAVNAPIQGGASDLNLRTLHRMERTLLKREFKSRVVSTVHDNIIIDTHKSETKQVVSDLHTIAVNPFPSKIWENQLRRYERVPFEIEVKIGENQSVLEEVSLPEYYVD